MRIRAGLLLALALLMTSVGVAAEPAAVQIEWGARVPLRDGAALNATIYRPAVMDKPLPVIFTLTPYVGDTYHDRAKWFAARGYVDALVDVRGRGNSAGEFVPFTNDSLDGRDAVDWFARQAYCDGQVTMWGGSYAGFNQWATAKQAPPALKTIVPAAAAHPGVDFPFFRNIFTTYAVQWLTLTSGNTGQSRLFGDSVFWIDRFRAHYEAGAPYAELDRFVANTSTQFQTWLRHPEPDDYWDAMVPTPAEYARIRYPVLTITGHYDGDQPGALTYYERHMASARSNESLEHYLIIGPWDHAGTRTPTQTYGGIDFGAASLLDLNQLHLKWYDWTLKGGNKPAFLRDKVAYYLLGPNEWRYASTLAATARSRRTWYLASSGPGADRPFGTGQLAAAPAKRGVDSYVYDPRDRRKLPFELAVVDNGLTDQRGTLAIDGDGLVYTSASIREPFDLVGRPRLEAFIALDAPDIDFLVTVSEILIDGTAVQLSSDVQRARYRRDLRKPQLVRPGAIERYSFESFTFVARRISAGSRLRLTVTSPNSIFLQRNFAAGGEVARESNKDARRATVQLYHDATRRSRLELPIA